MKTLLLVLVLAVSSAHADSLTVNMPLRADTYAGDFLQFDPPDIVFSVQTDDAHNPPIPDRIHASDFDATWSIWTIELCDDGHCGTVRHVCASSAISSGARTEKLDCLDIDC